MTRQAAKRAGGRQNRKALRAAGPAMNPAPPGQIGGHYKPMSEADCAAIYTAALDLLATLGMGEVPQKLGILLTKAGAVEDDRGRFLFPKALVQAAIKSSAKKFFLHGRDPSRSIEVGGDAVHFGTGGAAVQTLDLETQTYRPSTLRDLYDFTRLQDQLTNVSWFTRCCVATDVPGEYDLDVNTVFALLKGTTKPVATSFTLAEHVAPIVRMLDMAAGGPGAFSARPYVKAHISPVISPMRYGEDAVDVVFECISHNIPISNITAAQSGATAPATLAGFLAQSLAETLASLVMIYVIKPGHPMVFSNWPLVIDLRTGAFSGGGGEVALLNAASAQMSNWLGLPSGVAASMTDSKILDTQYGFEKGMTALAAGLAGGNLIYESSGMMAALLGASFEAFVADDEMISAVYRMLRGVEVSKATLDIEGIEAAILGDGHFLGGAETLSSMERDYYYPKLSDRIDPRSWEMEGRQDLRDRARAKARSILDEHHPNYLDPVIEREIRREFNILLD